MGKCTHAWHADTIRIGALALSPTLRRQSCLMQINRVMGLDSVPHATSLPKTG